MGKSELSDKEKTVLNGRIYPAIIACVNNRYKIILSFFAYYAFILNTETVYSYIRENHINVYVSLLFTFFIVHNFLNYVFNAKEEIEIEKGKPTKFSSVLWSSNMEVLFSIFSLLMIWSAFIVFCITSPNMV